MPSLLIRSISSSWRDGAALASSIASSWRDGVLLVSTGSPFVLPAPPPGSTPTSPSTDADFVLDTPIARVIAHDVTITDRRDGTPVEFSSLSIGTDDGSVCWTLNASAPESVFERFTSGDDLPVVSVMLDGVEWLFVIEGVSRSRAFGSKGLTLTGRSLTITAGDPYTFPQNWINDGPASAAQIVDQAQLYTGLEVIWGLEDWLVPDKVWSFSGTPLAVAKRVAESVAAIIVADRSDLRISILPRYRFLPNEWPTVAPDVEIHLSAAITDSYERADQPEYNGVYVSGQQQGALGRVYLVGTDGTRLAPLVTDLLLTDIAAVRQRGFAILGGSGRQARIQMTLPVVAGLGVLNLNALCRVVGDGPTWYGIVRAVSVSVSLPSVLQSITLERHTKLIEGTSIPPAPPPPIPPPPSPPPPPPPPPLGPGYAFVSQFAWQNEQVIDVSSNALDLGMGSVEDGYITRPQVQFVSNPNSEQSTYVFQGLHYTAYEVLVGNATIYAPTPVGYATKALALSAYQPPSLTVNGPSAKIQLPAFMLGVTMSNEFRVFMSGIYDLV